MCGKRNELKKGGASCYPPELLASYFGRYDALVAEGIAEILQNSLRKESAVAKQKGKPDAFWKDSETITPTS